MPEVKEYSHLISYIQDMGYYSSTGMGIAPLSYTEIKSYIELMRLNLSIFEISMIRKLSVGYVGQYNDSYIDTKAPYENEITLNELNFLIDNAQSKSKNKV